MNFWQRRFSSWGKSKKQEIALRSLNIFDGDEIRLIIKTLGNYLPLSCQHKNGRSDNFVDYLFRRRLDPKYENDPDETYYLLLGETGVGKTTALAHLFTRLAIIPQPHPTKIGILSRI